MALIHCPECNQLVSDRAKACPHCGFDMTAPKCIDCGTYLPEGATACPACGCPVEAAPAPVAVPKADPVPAAAPQMAPVAEGPAVPTFLTFPAPHESWKKAIPDMVIMDQAGTTTYGVVEWNSTVTIPVSAPVTLEIRFSDEAALRGKNVRTGIAWMVLANIFLVLAFVESSMILTLLSLLLVALFILGGVLSFVQKVGPLVSVSVTPGKTYEFCWNGQYLTNKAIG